MNKLCLILFCFAALCSNAQVSDTAKPLPIQAVDTNVRVVSNSSVQGTLQKVQQYEQLSHGTFMGYRIQIHSGSDRSEAGSIKTDFSIKYPSMVSYLTYTQPYFKVCAGDYRTKLEAANALGKIKRNYPGAFLVRVKINPPPLQ